MSIMIFPRFAQGRQSIRAAVNTFGFVFGHGFSFYRKLTGHTYDSPP
jgi:hypothetical protein